MSQNYFYVIAIRSEREAQVYWSGVAKEMLDPFSESRDPKTITTRSRWCFFWSTDTDSFKVLSANAILFSCNLPTRMFPFNYSQGTNVIWYNIFAKVQYQWWIDIQFMFIYVQWWFMLKLWEWSWPVCFATSYRHVTCLPMSPIWFKHKKKKKRHWLNA